VDHDDIAVIGGGSAGLVVAVGAAHLGARVALMEKQAGLDAVLANLSNPLVRKALKGYFACWR
jgi:pyruvate/2-oxoglutarate dehydrogenase complex dihydrolipoamide dehydrogenase (E3) component